jgi:hypothetical protein
MKTRREPDTLDEWAAILNPPFVPDPLDADELTVRMLMVRTGKSHKMASQLLLDAFNAGKLTRRSVHEASTRHVVFAYKPVKHGKE